MFQKRSEGPQEYPIKTTGSKTIPEADHKHTGGTSRQSPTDAQDPETTGTDQKSNDAVRPLYIVFSSIGLFVLLVAIFMAAFYFAAPWFKVAGLWLKDNFGLAGAGIFTFFVDCFPNFITSAILFAFVQDWNIPLLLAVMSLASMTGGITGYFLASHIGNRPRIKGFISRHLKKGKALFDRYGSTAVIIAALTPLPYAHICWIAGLIGLKMNKVVIASLFRVPHMILYYYAIKAGIILVTGA